MPIAWNDLLAEPRDVIPFLVDPYVPRGGTVLFYGKTSIGKSPLTWELARCVGSGSTFFGHQTQQGRVLYLETDTPKILVRERLRDAGLLEAENVWWEFAEPFNVLRSDDPVVPRLMAAYADVRPDLLIVNTLRKVYTGDDINSEIPTRVYKAFGRLFPGVAIWYTHHQRKTRGGLDDANVDEREDFAGSAAWLNDVQVGLQLIQDPKPKDAEPGALYVRLAHGKSQVSERLAPIHLMLREGAHWTVASDEERARIVSIWHNTDGTNEVKRRAVMAALGISRATAGRRLAQYGLISALAHPMVVGSRQNAA
jgi:hypothetical protein